MQSEWISWVVALFPGGASLLAALYSYDAFPRLLVGTKRSWSDIPTVEAVQDLSLHAVFYAPLWVAVLIGLFIDEAKLQGPSRYLVVVATAGAVCGFFALGRGCIAQVRQLERMAELAERKHEEELLAVASSRPQSL